MIINKSDKAIAWLALFSGLTISAVAIYYSVAGLVAIFSAAVIPIIVMGVVLEISKLVATVWLKMNWQRSPIFIRTYLLLAISILMVITSMGIFGFLSKAHSDQSLVSGDVQAKIAIFDEKIKIERENIANAQQVIKQMDAAVNGVIATGDQEVKLRDGSTQVRSAAERSLQIRRSQAKDRAALTKQIEEAQARIVKLQEEAAPIRADVRKVEAEVGPIKYIAKLIYGDNPDANLLEKAVTWVIIVIVIVFDPLAVILLLASQYSFQWFRDRKEDEETEMISDIYELENPTPVVETEIKNVKDPHPVGWMYPKHANIQEHRVEDTDEEEPKFDEKKPLDEWNEMIAEAERAVEEEQEENQILDSVPHTEKEAMTAWKKDNPESSLKLQKQLLEKGIIKELPWMQYLKPVADFNEDQEAAIEAAKWAQEQLDQKKEISWMEHDDQGNQIKKTKDTYQQNAEQSERTIWQRIQDAKK